MSIIRRPMSGGREELILLNPLNHRQLIFNAVSELFPMEMKNRICHYSVRPTPSKDAVEKTRLFSDDTPLQEANLSVAKAGQTYLVEGAVKNKISGNLDKVRGLVKAVPRKTGVSSEARDKTLQTTLSQILTTLSRIEEELGDLKTHIRQSPRTPNPYDADTTTLQQIQPICYFSPNIMDPQSTHLDGKQ